MTKNKKNKTKKIRTGLVNYSVGDFLIQIKNAVLAGNREITVRKTKLILSVAKKLKKENFLNEVTEKDGKLNIRLSYFKKSPVIMDLKLISKPGLRIYMSVDELENLKGPQTRFLSTPKGILTAKEAIKKRVGGEVLVEIL